MYHTKPLGPDTRKIHIKFLAPDRPFISVGLVIFLCFSLCLHILQNMSISSCLKVLSYSVSLSYIFMKCFICSISFHTSYITVAKPFYSPFSMKSHHTLIVTSETVFSEEIQF